MDKLTFDEFNMYHKAYSNIQREKLNMHITNAYYTEIFKRQDRSKKLPALKGFLVTEEKLKPKKPTPPEDILEQVKILNSVLGGELKIIES